MKLLGFVQQLRRVRIVVRTKNGYTIRGTVSNVDSFMNIYLRDAALEAAGQAE